MGYVPPSASELIRRDLEPMLTTLFARVYDVSNQFLGGRRTRPDGYRRYVEDLYGPPQRDWMPFLNYAMLGCMITLAIGLVEIIVR